MLHSLVVWSEDGRHIRWNLSYDGLILCFVGSRREKQAFHRVFVAVFVNYGAIGCVEETDVKDRVGTFGWVSRNFSVATGSYTGSQKRSSKRQNSERFGLAVMYSHMLKGGISTLSNTWM